jgi:hypothetical protein
VLGPAVDQQHSVAFAALNLTNRTIPLRERWVTTVNGTDNSSTIALRFQPKNCTGNATAICPVEDLSYCDEFSWLDSDCNGLVSGPLLPPPPCGPAVHWIAPVVTRLVTHW